MKRFSGDDIGWMIILAKKVWRMNKSAKTLLILTTNLDGFSLVNQ